MIWREWRDEKRPGQFMGCEKKGERQSRLNRDVTSRQDKKKNDRAGCDLSESTGGEVD